MATKLLDGFRYADQYSAINGDTSGLVIVTTPTVDGNGSLSFQRSATTEDSAGVKKAFTPYLDVSKYANLKVYAYIEAADLADIEYFDIIANSGGLEPYKAYEAQYEAAVLPTSFPTYPFTRVANGTYTENINSGVLELTTGSGLFSDQVYYTRDMSVDWLTPSSDKWLYVKHRCKMPVGAPTTSGASFAMIEANYRGKLVDLELGDGLIRWNSGAGSYGVDTTTDFIDIEIFIHETTGDFILLVDGAVATTGTAITSATSWLRFGIQYHNPGFAGMAEWEHVRWARLDDAASFAVYRIPKADFVDVNGDAFVGDAWAMLGFSPRLPTFQIGTPDLEEVAEYGYRMIFPAHTATPTIKLDSLEAETPILYYEEPVVTGTWEIDNEIIEPFTGTVIDSLNDPGAWTGSGGAGTLALDGAYTLVGGSALLVPKTAGFDAALISRAIDSQNFGDYDFVQPEFYIEASEVSKLRGIFLYLCNDVSNYATYYFGNNIFDTFEAITPWTPDVNASVALDTVHVIEGSKSVKLTNDSAGPAVYTGASRTYDPFALYAPLFYTFYLTTAEAANLTNFKITFTDGGGTTYWEFSSFSAGWNRFEINSTNFTGQTGTPTLTNITQVDIEIKTSTTGISIYLDNSRFSIPWNDIQEGWNRGFFKVKDPAYTLGTVDYTAIDLVYLKYVTFQEEAISTFRWDSLSRFSNLVIDNAVKVFLDYSDFVDSPSSLKFDKLFGELYGGAFRDYAVTRDYNVFDKLAARFKISQDDVDRVDKFQVILDETNKYEKFRAFTQWTKRYDGSYLPAFVYGTLMEDFETIGDFTPGADTALSANTTQFTEGTQSVKADYSGAGGEALTEKNYTSGLDFTGQTAVDFYIPAGMIGNINSVSVRLWEGSDYSQYDYQLSFIGGWQTLSFNPNLPDYESASGLTRESVTKVTWLYDATTVVTGFSWDNMRMSDWALVFP